MKLKLSDLGQLLWHDPLLGPHLPRDDIGRRIEEIHFMSEVLRRYHDIVDVSELTWSCIYASLKEALTATPAIFSHEDARFVQYGLAVLRYEVEKITLCPSGRVRDGRVWSSPAYSVHGEAA